MNKTMLTDLYQLTMNAAYYDSNKDDVATFELFIRNYPKDWGYFIANGIEDAIDYATSIKFSKEDIDYLRNEGLFKEEYLNFLSSFRFEGDIYAVKEGIFVAANAPIMQVTAKRTQAQFLETTLLNIINFQTMIATKANRIVNAAQNAKVIEFGLRRAHEEDAAMKGARAAYISGAIGTSNVKAGMYYGIPIAGTHAHSFVMSFPSEIEAFRAYANAFPDNATLLIDTYNTVQGAKNAIIIGKELEQQNKKLNGVRIDSGELCELSKKVRDILDSNGLNYVKIIASNDLNEYKINELIANGAKIDAFGVGTELITSKPIAALPGVYKLVEDSDGGKIKLSSNKATYPGKKQVYRMDGYDIISLADETINGQPLLEQIVKDGIRITKKKTINEIRVHCLENVAKLPDETKQICAEPYKAIVSGRLKQLGDSLMKKYAEELP